MLALGCSGMDVPLRKWLVAAMGVRVYRKSPGKHLADSADSA